MNIFEIVGGVLMAITSILIVLLVAMQKPKSDALSSLSGASDSFFNQNTERTLDATLARWTRVLAVGFFIITIAVYVINGYLA